MHFPHLRTLALSIHSLLPEENKITNARALAELLELTPTLQHAAWRHIDPGPLHPRALLSLRTLCADVLPDSPGVAGRALLVQGAPALLALGPVCVTPRTVDAMALRMVRRRSREEEDTIYRLYVEAFESFALLVRAVRLFPGLRWLRVPAVDYWYEHAPVTPAPVHPVRSSPPYPLT